MPVQQNFLSRTFEVEVDLQDWVRSFSMDAEDLLRQAEEDPSAVDSSVVEVLNLILEKAEGGLDDPSLKITWSVESADRNYIYLRIAFSCEQRVKTYLDSLTVIDNLFRSYYSTLKSGDCGPVSQESLTTDWKIYQSAMAELRDMEAR